MIYTIHASLIIITVASMPIPLSASGQDSGLKEAVGHVGGAWCPECLWMFCTEAEAATLHHTSPIYRAILNWCLPSQKQRCGISKGVPGVDFDAMSAWILSTQTLHGQEHSSCRSSALFHAIFHQAELNAIEAYSPRSKQGRLGAAHALS